MQAMITHSYYTFSNHLTLSYYYSLVNGSFSIKSVWLWVMVVLPLYLYLGNACITIEVLQVQIIRFIIISAWFVKTAF